MGLPSHAKKDSNMILNILNTTFYRQEELILDNFSMSVPKGSIYGLLGLNGAGKSSIIKLILNILTPTDGEIFIFEKELNRNNRNEILKEIGSLIENASIYDNLTVYENLYLSSLVLNIQSPEKRIQKVLELVGMTKFAHKRGETLSMGMKQRLGIGIALLSEPKFILLDEPQNGLDPLGIVEFRNLVKKLNKDLGVTFLITSHNLAELQQMVTHIGILHNKNIIFEDSIENIDTNSLEELFLIQTKA